MIWCRNGFALRVERVRLRTVLLDLDGTIFDIRERDAFARCRALNDLGYGVLLDDVKKYYRYGMGSMGLVSELGLKLTEKEAREYVLASFAHFTNRENALRLTRIHVGAFDALSALAERYMLVLVTSRDTLSSVEEELGWFNIRGFFALVVTREVAAKYYGLREIPLLPFEEQRTKLYECVLGLTKMEPEEMLCVGDAVSEIEPARKLGINVIGVLTGFSSREDMEGAGISVVNDLGELVMILS